MAFQPEELRVELIQVAPGQFQLAKEFSFTYQHPLLGDNPWVVNQEGLAQGGQGRTDLASVPTFLWWFVGSYGRHTRAALLHDVLVRRQDNFKRKDADTVFRQALADSKVPFIRCWLMWTAVSLETMFIGLPGKRITGGVLLLVHAVMLAVSAWFLLAGDRPWWLWLLVCALLVSWIGVWRWRAILIPVGAILIGLPSVLIGVARLVTTILEYAMWALRALIAPLWYLVRIVFWAVRRAAQWLVHLPGRLWRQIRRRPPAPRPPAPTRPSPPTIPDPPSKPWSPTRVYPY